MFDATAFSSSRHRQLVERLRAHCEARKPSKAELLPTYDDALARVTSRLASGEFDGKSLAAIARRQRGDIRVIAGYPRSS